MSKLNAHEVFLQKAIRGYRGDGCAEIGMELVGWCRKLEKQLADTRQALEQAQEQTPAKRSGGKKKG